MRVVTNIQFSHNVTKKICECEPFFKKLRNQFIQFLSDQSPIIAPPCHKLTNVFETWVMWGWLRNAQNQITHQYFGNPRSFDFGCWRYQIKIGLSSVAKGWWKLWRCCSSFYTAFLQFGNGKGFFWQKYSTLEPGCYALSNVFNPFISPNQGTLIIDSLADHAKKICYIKVRHKIRPKC